MTHKTVTYGHATLRSGLKIFYREAGHASPTSPTILLLHGFPSSSHQYRNLIPLLSHKYHVLAPDLPGFGFTVVPAEAHYAHTFANMAESIYEFLQLLEVHKCAVYIFDYGAPTALRIALDHPDTFTAIITQNGNAYEAGLGKEFWAPLQGYWKTAPGSKEYSDFRGAIKGAALTLDECKREYVFGEPNPEKTVDPASYTLDWTLMSTTPGNFDVQLDLFHDYRTNVALYPRFHKYLRTSQVPVLAIWGGNDNIFVAAGARAFEDEGHTRNVQVKVLDAGHFAVESHTQEIAESVLGFLKGYGV